MDSPTPEIYVRKVTLESSDIWFKSRIREPSEQEVAAWLPRYEEKALLRNRRSPLVVDVELERLRRFE